MVEPVARGFTFLTSAAVVVVFTLLLVGVMKRRVISYYLFARPRGPVYANTNQDVAARMRGIQQALIKYHEARRVAPESLDELQQNKFIVSDEGLKDAKGHWLYTYEKLTRREFYDYENPRILLCETPEAATAGVRHILFSNGNVVGIPASKFDDYVEKLRKAMAGRSAPTPDAPPSSPGANR